MDLKTSIVDGRIMEIISEDDYQRKTGMFFGDNISANILNTTAVETVHPETGDRYIFPFRGKNDGRPGIYSEGSIYFVKYPESDDHAYDMSSNRVIDFGDVSSIEDFLSKNNQIRDMETSVLSDVDTVFTPSIGENDSPAMQLFKRAVTMKEMDVSKYSDRFGDSYLNDMRILKTPNITLNKLIKMCNYFDIEAELRLRDPSRDVPNPMGKEISIVLNGGDTND